MNTPFVTLVGAGPGDPELLTLKGLRALERADVVLYDALVTPEILAFAPASALRVDVGKRAANHRYSQDEINLLLAQHALSHGHVVRLKGGDPFVFGRGHEELTYLAALGIPTAVVPGISSCISVPELQGVPVTLRGTSESFWVLTATTRDGSLSTDVLAAAKTEATAVILMGMRRLAEIAAVFAAAGRGNVPVLVVERGSTPRERHVVGAVSTIVERVAAAGLRSPGLIVIGEVVGVHRDFEYLNPAYEAIAAAESPNDRS